MRKIIVTGVNSDMWEDYLIFHISLTAFNNNYELSVIDLGLNDNQKDFVKGQENTVLIGIDQKFYKTIDMSNPDWRKWYKPILFDACIVDNTNTLWIDCDTVILDDLDCIFMEIKTKFVVMPDYFAPKQCTNGSELYEILKIEEPINQETLNSGVVGVVYPRDKWIIDKWSENVILAMNNTRIRYSISQYDQGALLLALYQLDIADRLTHKTEWNTPAKRLYCRYFSIDRIKKDHANSAIVHYAGAPKLSELLKIDNPRCINYNKQKFGKQEHKKTIFIGSDDILKDLYEHMRLNSRGGGCIELYENDIDENYFNRSDCVYSYNFITSRALINNRKIVENDIIIALIGDPIVSVKRKMLVDNKNVDDAIENVISDLEVVIKISRNVSFASTYLDAIHHIDNYNNPRLYSNERIAKNIVDVNISDQHQHILDSFYKIMIKYNINLDVRFP